MAKPLRILDEAVTEAHDAWCWYRERSQRAGWRFQKALDQSIEKILEQPDRWPEYVLGTQCILLKRFPYLIVYREVETEVQVIAVAHAHRRRGYWRKRLK